MSYRLLSDGVSQTKSIPNLNASMLSGVPEQNFARRGGCANIDNHYQNTGIYTLSTTTTGTFPKGVTYWNGMSLIHLQWDGNAHHQLLFSLADTLSSRIWRRRSTQGVWRDWEEIVLKSDLDSYLTRQEFEEFKATLSQPSATQSLIPENGGG